MTDINKNEHENENEDLICPITLELFRDPVRAEDGHVYEREAITKWILEHGTSPLTRQTLNIGNLQADERLKNLARERRNSSVSYHAANERVILPSISFRRNPFQSRIYPSGISHPIGISSTSNGFYRKMLFSIFCCVLIPTGVIIASVFAFGNSSNDVISIYNGMLTINSSQFNRLIPSTVGQFYYDPIGITVSQDGLYKFESQSLFYICAYLYQDSFNWTNVNSNEIFYDDVSGNDGQFYFQYSIQSNRTFILVVTTYLTHITGSFTLYIHGPANVVFN